MIGLALDLIGAIALVLGLFGHARGLAPGWSRSPIDVAHDVGFGVVGALFLSGGFVLQSLTYFGVRSAASTCTTLVAAGITVGAGGVTAWAMYGLLYLGVLGYERRREKRAGMHLAVRREGRIIRFWRQVPDLPDSTDT